MRSPTARSLAAVLVAGALAAADTGAQEATYTSRRHAYRVVTVAEGLEHPWSLAFLPEGGILVTERPGRLRVIRDGRLDPRPVEGVPAVRAQGQGGLLDVALHPEFATNRLVYLSFSKPGARGATTAVVRGRLQGSRLEGVQEVLEADAWGGGGAHFGSRMAFDRDGYLYVTVGDRGTMSRAQDPGDHAGSVLRLHDDGQVPRDNPFVSRPSARPEIYTHGNRNPQGLVVHPATGEVWAHEHGPRGGDEINLILPGRNYGWPRVTYGINYDGTPITDSTEMEAMEPPLLHWTPSIAPSGMAVYTGEAFHHWRGDVFVGALAGRHVERIRFEGLEPVARERLMEEYGERIRDVRNGPDGFLYLLVDAPRGRVIRLEPAAGS